MIYWAFPVYRIGSIHFFPNWFYSTLHLDQRLADGMALHFFLMWLFVLNGIAYVAYTIFSGEWRLLVPRSPRAFRDAWHVLLHDLHLRKEMPPPAKYSAKYNAAQQIAYSSIVLMGAGSVVTGFAIYKPAQLAWLTALCGGYTIARLLHFLLTAGYVVFFVIHVLQVILAGWNNFRSMVMGYELVNRRD